MGVDFNINYGKKILLIVVCEKGNLNIVKYLIDVGVYIDLRFNEEIFLIFVCK